MAAGLLHLHTYLLFPFAIDKEAVSKGQDETWKHNSTGLSGSGSALFLRRRPALREKGR